MTESSTQSRWPFREFRAVRSERESAGEWTSEGGPNRKPSRGRRESHPLSIGARMMVRVSERTYKRQFGWYRRSISFCPMSGAKAVFYFRLAPAQPKRSSATQTFYIFGGTQNEEQHDEEAPDHDSCLCHDPVSGRLRQQGRIPRRQLCRPEHRRAHRNRCQDLQDCRHQAAGPRLSGRDCQRRHRGAGSDLRR